ncbi:MAG: hypothetical protein KDI50_09765 [Candidatus Competibacteraceae bacterium]|nr:hypothetical protein [Candidatus Competibacteraceae bacterium]
MAQRKAAGCCMFSRVISDDCGEIASMEIGSALSEMTAMAYYRNLKTSMSQAKAADCKNYRK